MTRLSRTDLIHWADTKTSEQQLPELIRRLIVASPTSLKALVMPYGDSVGRSGLDGFVESSCANPYIPTGESIWEMGTNKAKVGKANDDFAKRTGAIAQFRQQELAYRCVTPRHWEKKADWETDAAKASDWQSIRVYDVDDLLGWLSDCPTVEAWFARLLGKPTAGLRDPQGYWANVGTIQAGTLGPGVLLGGREEATQTVQAHFATGTAAALGISCRSPAETIPFAVASIVASSDERSLFTTVVVESRDRWERVIVEESGLGLIVAPQVQPTREEIQQAQGQGHRVLYCSTNGSLTLPRISEFEVKQALISSGVGHGEAAQHATQCGGNGQLLLDRLSGLDTPAGKEDSRLDDRVKVACLLLVGWNGEHQADREIFTILSGSRYEDVEPALVADANDANGLLFRADGKFRLLSPESAWLRHATLITKSVLSDFADVVTYILADDDPTAGMSSDERLTAQFLGQRPEFSRTLRRHVVHSLAIAGSIGERLSLDPSMSPQFVDWIVRSSLDGATVGRWASLRSELSLLAEAAPEALLDALERDLCTGGPLADIMQHAAKPDPLSSPGHVGILWALERLCWSPEYIGRAVLILLRLAAFGSKGNSGNNPSNSIRETLQLYRPQTKADWKTRQDVIRQMLSDDVATAFSLVQSLLPDNNSMWHVRTKPDWRNWAYGFGEAVTYGQLAKEVDSCVDELRRAAGTDAGHWCRLLGLCYDVTDEQYGGIVDTYEERLAACDFDDQAKRMLWEEINALLIRTDWQASRRRLADGSVVDEKETGDSTTKSEPHFPPVKRWYDMYASRLSSIRELSKPTDPVLAGCHAFLLSPGGQHFSRHFPDRFNDERQQQLVTEARRRIAQEVWQKGSMPELLRLAAIPNVEASQLGRTCASCKLDVNLGDFLELFVSHNESDRELARGFVSTWAWERRDVLTDEAILLVPTLSDDKVRASFLCCLPAVPDVWECVDRQNERVQRSYWQVGGIPWDVSSDRLSYLVTRLIGAQRADRAIDLLSRQRDELITEHVESVFESLERLPLVVRDSEAPERDDNRRWKIQQLFNVLYEFGQSQAHRILELELVYNEIFDTDGGYRFQPQGLLMAISESPTLFVDLLRYPFKNDDGETTTPDEDQTHRLANKIASLLHRLGELPGESGLCPLPNQTTADWVREVVRIAAETRYLKAAQIELARIVTTGAWSEIESWPNTQISESINIVADTDLEGVRQDLSSGLFNSRGMRWMDPSGQAERSQSELLTERASQLQQSCPAAAWALREMAGCLSSESKRNIERAKWRA